MFFDFFGGGGRGVFIERDDEDFYRISFLILLVKVHRWLKKQSNVVILKENHENNNKISFDFRFLFQFSRE